MQTNEHELRDILRFVLIASRPMRPPDHLPSNRANEALERVLVIAGSTGERDQMVVIEILRAGVGGLHGG